MYSKQTEAKGWRDFRAAFEVLEEGNQRINFITKRYAKPFYKGKLTKRFQRILDRQERAFMRFSRNDPTLCLGLPKKAE